jgi:putative transposase
MVVYKEYPHYPPHLFKPNAVYLITGSVIGKKNYLDLDEKKEFLCETLINHASRLNWQLEAWACMSNHYHLIARAPNDAASMTALVRAMHSLSARNINAIDKQPGRRVWWNYWDTCIRDENSYLAMLRYVHENPVKHQVVEKAEDYPYCSYRWFLEVAKSDFQQEVLSQFTEHVKVYDDF